jgi:hypothetical protein
MLDAYALTMYQLTFGATMQIPGTDVSACDNCGHLMITGDRCTCGPATGATCEPTVRRLATIAADIRKTWAKPYFGAVPYIAAMASLASVRDIYGMDSGESIVRYFLANAGTWRGADARRIKAELKAML